MTSNIVSQATAAAKLGVSRQAVSDLIKRGRLKTVKIDGVPYVLLSSVKKFKRQKPGRKPASEKKAA